MSFDAARGVCGQAGLLPLRVAGSNKSLSRDRMAPVGICVLGTAPANLLVRSVHKTPPSRRRREQACRCHFLTLAGRRWNHLFCEQGTLDKYEGLRAR